MLLLAVLEVLQDDEDEVPSSSDVGSVPAVSAVSAIGLSRLVADSVSPVRRKIACAQVLSYSVLGCGTRYGRSASLAADGYPPVK